VAVVSPTLAYGEVCSERYPQWMKEQKSEYDACYEQESDKKVGKYFCFVEHMTGIQYPIKNGDPDETQKPFVGKIVPAEGKFFAEIHLNPSHLVCRTNNTREFCNNGMHTGRYSFTSRASDTIGYASSKSVLYFQSPIGSFYLNYQNSFVSLLYGINGGNIYMSKGKCEKLS
jgi:hypothetical protein